MSQGNFTDKWIHSSQDRLPGSFMNENHHTMTHVMNEEDNRNRQRQGRDSTKQSQQGNNYDYTQNRQQQTGQSSQLNDDDFLSQEPKRSVVGTKNDDFQKQQSSWIDENSDNYSRAKDQFPSAGHQQSPVTDNLYSGGTGMDQQQHQQHDMDDDPDLATKSAFQSVPQPVPISSDKIDVPKGPSSLPNSLDSNRAIMNQPLVSGQHNEDDNIQTATPEQDSIDQITPDHGFNPNAATTATPTATSFAGVSTANTSKGPLDPSGVMNNQQPIPSHSGQGSASPPIGRGKYKKRNSTPDNEYAAALPVLQSYVPYAQGVAVRTNNETRYEDMRQQQAATNRRYSLHGADEEHHGFSPVNDPDAVAVNKKTNASRRRSSLAESITKLFRRNSGTK